MLGTCLALMLAAPGLGAQQQDASGGEGQSSEARTLTLEDALRIARAQSPVFRQVANDESESTWQVRNAWASFLPSASVSSSASYQAEGRQRFGLFTSADIGAGTTTDYLSSDYAFTLSYNLSAATFARVGSARADARATEARVEAAEFDLQSNVTAQYLAALRARASVDAAQRSLERATENMELAVARVSAGAASPLDRQQADIDQSRAQVALLRAENSLRAETSRLLEQIGLQDAGPIELVEERGVVEPVWEGEDLTARALGGHPSLRALQEAEKARDADIWTQRSQYFPQLSLQANWSGFAREAGNESYLVTQAQQGLASARADCELLNSISAGLSSPLSGYPKNCASFQLSPADQAALLDNNKVFPFSWDPDPFYLNVRVTLPIFDPFTRKLQVERARNAADDAREARRAEELRLQTAVTQALDDLRTAYRVVGIEERARDLAEQNLEGAQERYRLGASSFLELLQAQEQFATAEQSHLGAVYDYHAARAVLEQAVGTRLELAGEPR